MDKRTDAGGRVVVIGVGNEFRRDDGAGPAVVTSLTPPVAPAIDNVADAVLSDIRDLRQLLRGLAGVEILGAPPELDIATADPMP